MVLERCTGRMERGIRVSGEMVCKMARVLFLGYLGEIMMPGQGYKKGGFENNSIVRVDQQEIVSNSFREAHTSAKTFTRSDTKKSEKESESDGKTGQTPSFKRRRLVDAKSIINSSASGKRCYFS